MTVELPFSLDDYLQPSKLDSSLTNTVQLQINTITGGKQLSTTRSTSSDPEKGAFETNTVDASRALQNIYSYNNSQNATTQVLAKLATLPNFLTSAIGLVKQKTASNGSIQGEVGPPLNNGAATPPSGTPSLAGPDVGPHSQDPAADGWGPMNSNQAQIKIGQYSVTVHKDAAGLFQGFLNEFESNTHYVIKQIGGLSVRRNANNSSVYSLHSWGLAIDINWDANPNGSSNHDIPDVARDIAHRWGLVWGLDFHGTKDPMHFEYEGTPAMAAARLASAKTNTPTTTTPANSTTGIPQEGK